MFMSIGFRRMDVKVFPMLFTRHGSAPWHVGASVVLAVGYSICALFAWHLIVGRWIWPKQWATVLSRNLVAGGLWILWAGSILILWAISQMGHG